MNTYIASVNIYVSGGTNAHEACTITVDSGGSANVNLRYPTLQSLASARRTQATKKCIAAGLVTWATVGPPGGEDSVLVATAALMDQLEPTFALTISGEEE